MDQLLAQLTSKDAKAFIGNLEKSFSGLPHLPKGITKFFVDITPWLAGFSGIVSILTGLSSLFAQNAGYGFMRRAMVFSGVNPIYFWIVGAIAVVYGFLLLYAFNLIKEKTLNGWIFLFWASMLGVIQQLVGVFFGGVGVVGLVISTVITLYLLFEIKPYYKK